MGFFDRVINALHLIPLSITFRHIFKKPITVQYPEEKLQLPEQSNGVHKLFLEKCISCGTCARVCPNNTIEMVEAGVQEQTLASGKIVKKIIKHPNVYLGRCMFCGFCEENCPTRAIKLTRNYELTEFNREDLLKNFKSLSETREDA